MLLSFAFLVASSVAEDHEAQFYRTLDRKAVQCQLCPRNCVLQDGQAGYCRVRQNKDGRLRSLVYAQVCALNVDPIEKKPLYHFLPGTASLSLATVGCNMRCLFCQNWSLSQAGPGEVEAVTMLPGDIVRRAREKSCPSISYTYSEPVVFYEYLYDAARLARHNHVRNVMVTSGHINPEPMRQLCAVLDAANVDLKGFSDDVYGRMASTKLAPVLEAMKIVHDKGVWLEVGYLVIPTVNDDSLQIAAMCRWLADSLGRDVPLHFLRFFPQHQLSNLPPTPVAALEAAWRIAQQAGIRYVYLGNIPGHRANHTYCHRCRKLLIRRRGYFVDEMRVKAGRCPDCGTAIPGVWK